MATADKFALAWLLAGSVITFLAFGFDKWCAGRSSRRVPELYLVLLGALGGWLGGWLGMKVFRHKTLKRSFQIKYGLGLLPLLAVAWLWRSAR